MSSEILSVENIEKYYGNKGNVTKEINNISFKVYKGEFVGIMGASGSGKTTLLNCISTIDSVTAGKIIINGRDITRLKSNHLDEFRKNELGFIFQDFNLLDTLTAYENIALALTIKGEKLSKIHEKIISILSYPILLVHGSLEENLFNEKSKENLFEVLNIDFRNKIIDDKSRNLSFGEQQKLNLLRVLSRDSSVIILDEHFTNLDKESIESLTKYILSLKGKVSIIAITHSPELDESADYILNIVDGKIVL